MFIYTSNVHLNMTRTLQPNFFGSPELEKARRRAYVSKQFEIMNDPAWEKMMHSRDRVANITNLRIKQNAMRQNTEAEEAQKIREAAKPKDMGRTLVF